MRADVAVVGLGAVGSSVLFQLSRLGIRAIGIDRFHPPHTMGSSHGETRITRLAVGEGDAYAPLVRRSHEIWRELEQEGGDSLFQQTGGLIMAPRDSAARHHGRENFVRRSIALAEKFGIPHEVLDAREIMSRYPQFALRGDEMAYLEPSAGMLAPESCISTQLRLARDRGAEIRMDERVLDVLQQGDGVRLVTDRGVVEAARCVLTTGPWLAGFMEQKLRPLAKVYRQELHWFRPDDPARYSPDRFPVFIWMHGDREEDYFYGFPAGQGSGDVKVATESYECDVDPAHVERRVSAEASNAIHEQHVAGRLSGIGNRPTRSAACLYTVTPDSGFIVDTLPGRDHVLAVSACSGHGFKHSAALGEAIAQQIAGEQPAIDISSFQISRLSHLYNKELPI